jgi:diadenosine tetraphosphate (Ap4A) HIT family hydrolase
MRSVMSNVVFENAWFTATGCSDCEVPGYLILSLRSNAPWLSDLPIEPLSQLGKIVAVLAAQIKAVTHAERVYILRFSEGNPAVHFHLFPRTEQLAHEWREATGRRPDDSLIGEDLFSWARIHKRKSPGAPPSDAVESALVSMRRGLATPSRECEH